MPNNIYWFLVFLLINIYVYFKKDILYYYFSFFCLNNNIYNSVCNSVIKSILYNLTNKIKLIKSIFIIYNFCK